MRENSKNNFDGNELYHWRKDFMKIKIVHLMKPRGQQLCFVFINRAINIFLDPKNPFAANSLFVRR